MFILVPLLIVVVAGVVLLSEHLEPDHVKAIRLVKESNSRKENFTQQQYLYMTVHHRKRSGDPITIEGWRATHLPGAGTPMIVEFSYEDSSAEHVAMWEADLEIGTVTPKNDEALDLSWH